MAVRVLGLRLRLVLLLVQDIVEHVRHLRELGSEPENSVARCVGCEGWGGGPIRERRGPGRGSCASAP